MRDKILCEPPFKRCNSVLGQPVIPGDCHVVLWGGPLRSICPAGGILQNVRIVTAYLARRVGSEGLRVAGATARPVDASPMREVMFDDQGVLIAGCGSCVTRSCIEYPKIIFEWPIVSLMIRDRVCPDRSRSDKILTNPIFDLRRPVSGS